MRQCDICKRYYDRRLDPVDTSSIVINSRTLDKSIKRFYEVCPECADKIARYIEHKTMPDMCFFCEFDGGPKIEKHENCLACISHNNFKRKSEMQLRMKHTWDATYGSEKKGE